MTRQATRDSHRSKLQLQVLEDRTQPAAIQPIRVALISDQLPQAAQIQAAANPGVLAVTYNASTATLDNLVARLGQISASHGGAKISQLGLVAKGQPGAVTLGPLDTLDRRDIAGHGATWEQLRGLLTPSARLDLYASNVAAGRLGEVFVAALARRTGADIYASTNAVGSGNLGDFTWEYNTATAAPINQRSFASYRAMAAGSNSFNGRQALAQFLSNRVQVASRQSLFRVPALEHIASLSLGGASTAQLSHGTTAPTAGLLSAPMNFNTSLRNSI